MNGFFSAAPFFFFSPLRGFSVAISSTRRPTPLTSLSNDIW